MDPGARLELRAICCLVALALGCPLLTGCMSPYHADRGALFGGVTGAGVGALVGNASGNAAAGALIGTGVGAVTGAAIGQGMDDVEARNRAAIEAQLGRQLPVGTVTPHDVIEMTRAGVNEELIIGHVRSHGMAAPLTSQDLIVLQNSGVSVPVVQAMQAPPPVQPMAAAAPVAVAPAAVPVYPGPYYYPPPPPRVGVGFAVGR